MSHSRTATNTEHHKSFNRKAKSYIEQWKLNTGKVKLLFINSCHARFLGAKFKLSSFQMQNHALSLPYISLSVYLNRLKVE